MTGAIWVKGFHFLSLAAHHQGATAVAIPPTLVFIVCHSAKLALLQTPMSIIVDKKVALLIIKTKKDTYYMLQEDE